MARSQVDRSTSRNVEQIKELSRVTKDEWREYTKTVWHIANVTHPIHPAIFPEEIPQRLIKLFTFFGETVLDPFAGVGTTANAALKLGRNAICVEQNPEYVEIIHDNLGLQGEIQVQVVHGDSRYIDNIASDSVDLIVTSPPYWNKADYGTSRANLGSVSGYRQFLNEIRPAFQQCYRVLKPGRKICIVTANVNQYTEFGLLTFPLAADFTVLLRDLGFLLVTEVIWSKDGTGGKWGSWGNQRPIFGSYPYPPNFLFKNIHEHILILIKPPDERKNGGKVRRLQDIMRLDEAEVG